MRSAVTTILLVILFTATAAAQHLNVQISTSNWPNEPSIIINPKNTDHFYAGSNIANCYYSTDGGYSWDESVLVSQQYGVWGDPVLLCDTSGAFYFFHLSNPPGGTGSWIDRIVCQKVEAIGGEWNDGTYMGLNGSKEQDKHWAAVDWKNNNIYVTWTQFDQYGSSNPNFFSDIMFSRSTDGGLSWRPAVRINQVSGDCIDSDNTTEGAVPAVGPDGELYVAWAGPAGLVFDRSYDQGDTWLDEDIFIDEFPGGWDYDIPGISRCNGLPVTTCDTSGGPHHGTIYVNWTDQRNGPDDTDVWLVKSTDGGNTWSQPKRVNDDPPGRHQFLTWMAVDQTNGHLWFVFYDRRNYNDQHTDVYMARSTDGGETFVNFPVSDEPFFPTPTQFFGDYNNITAHDNVVRPIWTRLHDDQLSIWTAIVNPLVVGIDEEEFTPVSLGEGYPNPFSETTVISYKILRPMPVKLTVYNQLGQLVETIVDEPLHQPGKFSRKFDARKGGLAPGIYYFSLVSDDASVRQKIILAR